MIQEAVRTRARELALELAAARRYKPLLVGTLSVEFKGNLSLEDAESVLEELVEEGKLRRVEGAFRHGCVLGYFLV